MRVPQILVYESDRRIADLLRREGSGRSWPIREPRRLETCLRLLRKGGRSVLVLRLGRDLTQELRLLECVSWLFPETAAVVIGDAMTPALVDLVWDLGASLVLPPLPPGRQLSDVVASFLTDVAGNPVTPSEASDDGADSKSAGAIDDL
jgi:hypothetical protein